MNILEIIQLIDKKHHYKLPDFFSSKNLIKIIETGQQNQINNLIDEYINENGINPFKVALSNKSTIVPFEFTLNNYKNNIWFYKNNLINSLNSIEKIIIQGLINNGRSIEYYYVNLNKITDWLKEIKSDISETKLFETLQKLNNRSNSLVTKNTKGHFRFEPIYKENKKLYLDLSNEPQILTTWESTFTTEMLKRELMSILRDFPGSEIDQIIYKLRKLFPDVQIKNVSRTLSSNSDIFYREGENYFITSVHDDRSLYPMLILYQLLNYRYNLTGAVGIEDNGIPEETLIEKIKSKGFNIDNNDTFRSAANKIPLRHVLQRTIIENVTYYQFKRDDLNYNLTLGKIIYYNFCPVCGKEVDGKQIEIKRYISSEIVNDVLITDKMANHLAEYIDDKENAHYSHLKNENFLKPSNSSPIFALTQIEAHNNLLKKFNKNYLYEYQQ